MLWTSFVSVVLLPLCSLYSSSLASSSEPLRCFLHYPTYQFSSLASLPSQVLSLSASAPVSEALAIPLTVRAFCLAWLPYTCPLYQMSLAGTKKSSLQLCSFDLNSVGPWPVSGPSCPQRTAPLSFGYYHEARQNLKSHLSCR